MRRSSRAHRQSAFVEAAPDSGLGDLTERRLCPARRQLAHVTSTSLSSSSSGPRSSPNTCAALPSPPDSTNGVYAKSSAAIPSDGRDVVADPLEPEELLRREQASRVLLGEEPGAVALADELGIGHELVLLVERDPHEGDEVGQHPLARAAHLRAVERLVGLPQPLGRPPVRRAARSPRASSLTSRKVSRGRRAGCRGAGAR